MLKQAIRLARYGLSVHWLREADKAPFTRDWANAPVMTEDDLEATYKPGYNLGMRPGEWSKIGKRQYLVVLDVDVKGDQRDADEAFDYLDEILPRWRKLPHVLSGGGGHGRHIYLITDEPMAGKKLAHSKRSKIKWVDKKGKDKSSWPWEVQLMGTGMNLVLPPSIHPETGNEYVWGREIDWDALDLGIGPIFDHDEILSWARDGYEDAAPSKKVLPGDEDDTDLASWMKVKTLDDVDYETAEEYLADLEVDEWCDDREGWIKVGMALHHQFSGDPEALEMWIKFSQQSGKFEDGECEKKWTGFGKDKRRRPVRFTTIIAAANSKRMVREYAMADNQEDMDREIDTADGEADDNYKWTMGITRSEKGMVQNTSNNIELILAHDVRTKGVFRYNEFKEQYVISASPKKKMAKTERRQKHVRQLDGPLWQLTKEQKIHGKPIEDRHESHLRGVLSAPISTGGHAIQASQMALTDALTILSDKESFHPVKDFLESLEWDGTPRLDTMFVDWLGCNDDEYHRQIARIFCVAAIARIYTPGIKFDYAPILEGPQGIRKSWFISTLARSWFVELKCGFDDPKKIVETLAGAWIGELPELSQFNKSDIETVKAFFTAQQDVVREAYGRRAKEFKRQSVMMGSTNNKQYLKDETGNRRFWPVECSIELIDIEGFKKVVDQIWAEALMRYDEMVEAAGSRWDLFLDLTGKAAKHAALGIQESRRVESDLDSWAGMIQHWLDTPVTQAVIDGGKDFFEDEDKGDGILVKRETCCAVEIWCDVLGGRVENLNRGVSDKISLAIQKVPGITKIGPRRTKRFGNQKCYGYVRPKRSLDDLLS